MSTPDNAPIYPEMSERALELVRAVGHALEHPPPGSRSPYEGDMVIDGWAHFFAYADLLLPEEGFYERGAACFEKVVEELAAGRVGPHWLANIAWVLNHLARVFLEHQEAEEFLCSVDDYLHEALMRLGQAFDFGMWGGLAGFGRYALRRPRNQTVLAILDRVLDGLEATAVRVPDGIAWRGSILPSKFPDGCFELGPAHGLAGVIHFLASASASGTLQSRTQPLYAGAMGFARTVAIRFEGRLPSAVALDGTSAVGSGWCRGPPGTEVVLAIAGRLAGDHESERKFVELAGALADGSLADPDALAKLDCSLCHGTSGIAHSFRRLFEMTGDERFRAAARRWVDATLERRREGAGVAGFLSNYGPEVRVFLDSTFVSGAPGIALSVAAAAQGDPAPDWDSHFATSLSTPTKLIQS
jgi:lantibiotic biosynthesis protein